ncbi:hypothetical protein, partial [Aliivibrio finisterrensis]
MYNFSYRQYALKGGHLSVSIHRRIMMLFRGLILLCITSFSQPALASLSVINDWVMSVPGAKAPTASDYQATLTLTDTTIVVELNGHLRFVHQIDAIWPSNGSDATKTQFLQDMVNGYEAIHPWIQGVTGAQRPTLQNYIDSKLVASGDVTNSDINYINDQVIPFDNKMNLYHLYGESILKEYQAMLNYANGSNFLIPSTDSYRALKTTMSKVDKIVVQAAELSKELNLTSINDIRAAVVSYYTIYDHFVSRNTIPTLSDYHNIGLTYLTSQDQVDSINNYVRAFSIRTFAEIKSVASRTIIQLEYPIPLTQGSTISLSLPDTVRYRQSQVDWYSYDGVKETLLQSNQRTYSIQSGQLHSGDTVFARVNAGMNQYDTKPTGGYVGDSGSDVDISLTHNQSNTHAPTGKTLEITNASLLVNGTVVASAPTYQWFAFNKYEDFGQPSTSLASEVTLNSQSTNRGYKVNDAEQAGFYAVEVTFNHSGQNHSKVLTFPTSQVLLPEQNDDPQYYENLLLNELNLRSNLKVWLDATDEQTLFSDSNCTTPANDGDSVACWQDKSVNGANFYDLNSRVTGGLGAPSSKAFGKPTYISAYNKFSGASAVNFDRTDAAALGHKLVQSEHWSGDYSLAYAFAVNKEILSNSNSNKAKRNVFNTNISGSFVASSYISRFETTGSAVTEQTFHYTDVHNNWLFLYKQESINDDLLSPRVFGAQAECIVNPDNSTQELCLVDFRRDGAVEHTGQAINGTDMFQSYGLNAQQQFNTSTTGDMAFQTLMIFDKKLNECETYLVDKYLSLKLGKALKSSFNFGQSRTGFTNSSRILGFDPLYSVACRQDIFLSQTSSGYMDVSFEIDNPSVSDYDLIARDEYLIVGHNGADVASPIDISTMSSPPSLPAGSSVTTVLERKWLVDFKSVSGVADPIKQVSLKYDFTLAGLDLSVLNYPKPYLVIQRGSVPIEIEGHYQGADSVAFEPIDFQHGDTVQLAFNTNVANTAPTSSNHSIFIDSPHAFSANDFAFSDPDNDALYQVRITSLPTQGTLTLNGSSVSNGDEILVSDLADLSLNFDNTATLPIVLKYEVSDGFQWSNESDLSINQLKIYHQLSPKHVTYRVRDELSIHTLAELNYQPLSVSVDYVWWTVNSANNIGEYYDPIQHTALSVEDSYTISPSSVGKYLLIQAEYTEPNSGQSVKSILPIGFIEAADAPTRPTVPWASQLNVNSQYVYENLTIVPELALRDDNEVLPPNVEYCFYDEDTSSVLQACGAADTFLVTSGDKDKTIRVEAILTDSNSLTIEAQTLTAYLFPRATSNNLSRPVISPTRDLTLNSIISLTSEPRFQASGTMFQWYRYRNGQYTPINGANGDSYTISWADMSATILLQVTVDDNGVMVPIESNMTENVEYQLAVDMVLGHETPLHVDDEITLLNKSAVEQAVQGVLAQNGNFEASYTWQYSPNNGTSWFDQATYDSIKPLISLADNRIYRLRLDIGDGLALVVVYSNNSPAVQSGLSYNIDFGPLSAPIQDVSYDVYSQLTSSASTSYDSRTHQWSRVEADGTLTPLSTDGAYTPTSNDVGFVLRVTISYLDASSNVLVSRAVETPP